MQIRLIDAAYNEVILHSLIPPLNLKMCYITQGSALIFGIVTGIAHSFLNLGFGIWIWDSFMQSSFIFSISDLELGFALKIQDLVLRFGIH